MVHEQSIKVLSVNSFYSSWFDVDCSQFANVVSDKCFRQQYTTTLLPKFVLRGMYITTLNWWGLYQ